MFVQDANLYLGLEKDSQLSVDKVFAQKVGDAAPILPLAWALNASNKKLIYLEMLPQEIPSSVGAWSIFYSVSFTPPQQQK